MDCMNKFQTHADVIMPFWQKQKFKLNNFCRFKGFPCRVCAIFTFITILTAVWRSQLTTAAVLLLLQFAVLPLLSKQTKTKC